MAPPPHAFLSYTRIDDEFHGGAITALRRQLELGVRVVTGDRTFTIFQDVEGIEFGQHWPSRLDEALAGARFLVPVLSPSFFGSEPCRDELAKFLELEQRAGRRDLILPLYLVTAPVLEQPARRAADPLAQAVSERQRRDWRPYAYLPADHADHRRAIFELAQAIAAAVDRVGPAQPLVGPVRQRARKPKASGDRLLTPGTVFRDVEAPWCPEMVVIPSGRFLMGSPEGEEGRVGSEGPQHEVRFARPFALGRFAVTFAEYDAFCEATGRERPGDSGWGRGRRPVINVSWEEARAYCAWLSERTGRAYRLPSEAEWEYACRAGTATRFSWGDEAREDLANFGRRLAGTAEVGSYPANGWGLCEMHGNVWEWSADAWHGSYVGAPVDGSAWTEGGDLSGRVVRGGSWVNQPEYARSAIRLRYEPDDRIINLGFRVSRTLTP